MIMDQTQLDNIFTKKQPLFIVSSTRAKKEFYLHFAQKSHLNFNLNASNANQDSKTNESILQNCFLLFDFTSSSYDTTHTNTFLPAILTIAEFFTKITFTESCMIPKNVRDFFMFQALQNIKNTYKQDTQTHFLNFETSFMLFLQTSSVLLQFYDELREHKIPITKESLLEFGEIDTYEEYNEQLTLVAAIYEEYLSLLQANNLTDSLYSNTHTTQYQIFTEYIASFSSIHIELEGFISPLQYEILTHVSAVTPVFLHFKTDYYNIGHFHFLEKTLEPFKYYIYVVATGELFTRDLQKLQLQNIKLYKTTQTFAQANLAIALAHKWQEAILHNEACENDFAVILPNESFCNHLMTLDSHNLFNFAMGINIAYLESYNTLVSIHEQYLQTKQIHLTPLITLLKKQQTHDTPAKLNALQAQCMQDSQIILNPNITHLESIVTLLFSHEETLLAQIMHILATLNLIANEQFFNVTKLTFEHIFMLFMREIAGLTSNDVSGGKIRVIGALEARNLRFKEVLILDFTDDFVPHVTHDDVFLNSKIRTHYNMPTRLDKENLYKHHYYNIMRNTQITHISFVYNDEKIPSNMLFELHCNIESAQSIDTLYSYYDKTQQSDITFYDDIYKPFDNHTTTHLSATALNTYRDCIRKFYFRYIENLREEVTQSQHIGTIIHAWLYEAYMPYQGKILTKDSIDIIESHFFEKLHSFRKERLTTHSNKSNATEQIDMTTFVRIDNFSVAMQAFFAYEKQRVQESCVQLLGLEYQFQIPYKNYTFLGFIDRIDKVDSSIIFYDYKTGATLPKKDNLQMPFYALCALDMPLLQPYRNMPMQFCYYHLAAKQTQKMLQIQDEKILQTGINTINTILQTFGQENIMTDKIATCKACDYALLCNRD